MRCPNLVMSDKFFCISEGNPKRRGKDERREHCISARYRKCPHFRDHVLAHKSRLDMLIGAC